MDYFNQKEGGNQSGSGNKFNLGNKLHLSNQLNGIKKINTHKNKELVLILSIVFFLILIALFIGVFLQIIFTVYLFLGGRRLFLLTTIQLTPYLAIPSGYIYLIAPVMAIFMIALSFRNLIFILKDKQGETN